MMIDLKSTQDSVLTELWAIKDERAARFGDIDHLVAHLRALESDRMTLSTKRQTTATPSRSATTL
jgi:hypothetical protein